MVKYRPRKRATQKSIINRDFRNGRTYDDFQKLLKVNSSLSVVEMHIVEGLKGGKVLLTMLFRNCSLMLAFLLETKTQKEVRRIFDELTEMLGLSSLYL